MIGWLMRTYRRSPLHPGMGKWLAAALGIVTSRMRSPRLHVARGLTWELDLREVIDASLFFSGSFEPLAERTLERHLGAGDFVIDVGANVGYHTLPMARKVGSRGAVVAVEPNPAVRARLERNLALNALGNVRVVAAAVGDQDQAGARLRIQSTYRLSGDSVPEEIDVAVARLDRIVEEQALARVDLIKIDVDGHEAKVFRGAESTIERFRPIFFFELTPSAVRGNGDSAEGLLEGLLSKQYRLADEGGRPLADWRRRLAALGPGDAANLLAVPAEKANRPASPLDRDL